MCFTNDNNLEEIMKPFSEMFAPRPGDGICPIFLPPMLTLHTLKVTVYCASNLNIGGSWHPGASNLEQI